MPTLYLVRHGQASLGAEDYDKLSELGVEQSRELGRYLARVGRTVDRTFAGPMKRQVGTSRELTSAALELDHAIPETEVLDGLAEFPAFEIFERAKEEVSAFDEQVRLGLAGALGGEGYRMALERVLRRWVEGSLGDLGDLETFEAFDARVRDTMARLLEDIGPGGKALVVTSGGPIAMMVAHSMSMPPQHALRMMWAIANGSFHVVKNRHDGWVCTRFNAIPHLEAKGMVTYV